MDSITDLSFMHQAVLAYLIYGYIAKIVFKRPVDKRLRGLAFLILYFSFINAPLVILIRFFDIDSVMISKIYLASVLLCAFIVSDVSKYEA